MVSYANCMSSDPVTTLVVLDLVEGPLSSSRTYETRIRILFRYLPTGSLTFRDNKCKMKDEKAQALVPKQAATF